MTNDPVKFQKPGDDFRQHSGAFQHPGVKEGELFWPDTWNRTAESVFGVVVSC